MGGGGVILAHAATTATNVWLIVLLYVVKILFIITGFPIFGCKSNKKVQYVISY